MSNRQFVALRLTLGLAVAVALGSVHLSGRPPTLCAFRALTGVPCPFCGGTTAAVELGRGHLGAALAASPLAVLGAPVVAALPVLRAPLARLPPRWRWGGLLVVLAAAETWQLVRFGLL